MHIIEKFVNRDGDENYTDCHTFGALDYGARIMMKKVF